MIEQRLCSLGRHKRISSLTQESQSAAASVKLAFGPCLTSVAGEIVAEVEMQRIFALFCFPLLPYVNG